MPDRDPHDDGSDLTDLPPTGKSDGEAPPTGDVIEAEEGGTQEPIDGP